MNGPQESDVFIRAFGSGTGALRTLLERLPASGSRSDDQEAVLANIRDAMNVPADTEPPALAAMLDGANESANAAVVRGLLSVSVRIPFDTVYAVRRTLIAARGAAIGPREATSEFIDSMARALTNEGVRYAEITGNPGAGYGPAEAQQAVAESTRGGLRVEFLEFIPTRALQGEPPQSVARATRAQNAASEAARRERFTTQARAAVAALRGTTSDLLAPEDRTEIDALVRVLSELPEDVGRPTLHVLTRGFLGVDFGGPEGAFGGHARRITRVYEALRHIARLLSCPVVLRIHAGEGYNTFRPSGEGHREIAQTNVRLALDALEAAHHAPASDVVVRLGHITHIGREDLDRMRTMGVYGEIMPTSNATTYSIPANPNPLSAPATPWALGDPPDLDWLAANLPLLDALIEDVPVVIATDGGGVYRTNIREELRIARRIIARYREGTLDLSRSPRGTRPFAELSPEQAERVDFTRLIAHLRAYFTRMNINPPGAP
jgi:hypothetical protein